MKFSEFIAEAPSKPASSDNIELLIMLMQEIGVSKKLKLMPQMQNEAMDEAIHQVKRHLKGFNEDWLTIMLSDMTRKMHALRIALQPLPAWEHQMEENGVWFDNKQITETLKAARDIQQPIYQATMFLHNLNQLLPALEGINRMLQGRVGQDDRQGLDAGERAFAAATFKKLGIL
jgi:hypothetical protein